MNAEITTYKLSDQVKQILHEKGLSKVFNYQDYTYFKNQVKSAFNKAVAIAELFIQDNEETTTDYHDYIY